MTQEIVLSMWYFWFSRILSAWSGGRGILKKMLSLCYSIVYYYNGAQRKGMSSSYRSVNCAGFDLAWFSTLSSKCLRSLWCYIYNNFFAYILLYLLVSWAWWDWPLTWLTNHCPSVLWLCWLGHLTHKVVSEMTYNVSSGTLNSTILYLLWHSYSDWFSST